MSGSHKDVEGECNAHLYIADDYSDGTATMRCQLHKGHDGEHEEIFYREDDDEKKHAVTVTWEKDERCWHEWVDIKSPEGKIACVGEIEEWMEDEDLKWNDESYKRQCENYDAICTRCKKCE